VVYGERDRETLRIFRLARFRLGPVVGDGMQELSVVYAGDLAAALIAAAVAPAAAGHVYYAAHPDVVTSRGLVEAVGRAVGARPRHLPVPGTLARIALWTVGSLAHLAGRATVLSADKADEFLAPAWTCRADALARDAGWQATIDLATGLARTAAWYRAEGWL
jgi:nucleoside-diphosphate-sugar epimerase